MVELGIALFNGVGVVRDEAEAAKWFERSARRGSVVGMNRYARVAAAGIGMTRDPRTAMVWHLRAKLRGLGDPFLDNFMQEQPEDMRKAAEAEVAPPQ
jgi:TPR repeat protein